jgi:hypothetical protein
MAKRELPLLRLGQAGHSQHPFQCRDYVGGYQCLWCRQRVVNALLTDNGFILPTRVKDIWCPGFISNVLIGTFSAFASWSFLGSGAGLDVSGAGQRTQMSLTFSALAGAFMVGVADARWITNEVDKKLLGESVKVAAKMQISAVECDKLVSGPPKQMLEPLMGTSWCYVSDD